MWLIQPNLGINHSHSSSKISMSSPFLLVKFFPCWYIQLESNQNPSFVRQIHLVFGKTRLEYCVYIYYILYIYYIIYIYTYAVYIYYYTILYHIIFHILYIHYIYIHIHVCVCLRRFNPNFVRFGLNRQEIQKRSSHSSSPGVSCFRSFHRVAPEVKGTCFRGKPWSQTAARESSGQP